MESKIPLPTDNIYKFMALFGLVLIIGALTLSVYSFTSTNQIILDGANKIYDLDSSEDQYKKEKIELIQKKIDVAKADKDFFKHALGAIIGIGIALSVAGFSLWYRIHQIHHDDMLSLQIEKLELEIRQLKRGAWMSFKRKK